MSYIGNTSTTQAFTPAVDYFSGNGSTTAFTLSRPIASVAQFEAVVNNVVQNPSSAYTVSGNTITFTSAPSSGTNNIYVRYTSPITQVIAPSAGSVGSSQLASLSTLPTTGGNITIPAVAGTMMVSGNMPAFSAYASSNQSVTTQTWTKVTLDIETFDTNNNFASSRFTPTVAGYYQINGVVRISSSVSITRYIIGIWKNGAEFARPFEQSFTSSLLSNGQMGGGVVAYLNGSTDYVELYAWINGTGTLTLVNDGASPYTSSMNGVLVRAA